MVVHCQFAFEPNPKIIHQIQDLIKKVNAYVCLALSVVITKTSTRRLLIHLRHSKLLKMKIVLERNENLSVLKAQKRRRKRLVFSFEIKARSTCILKRFFAC